MNTAVRILCILPKFHHINDLLMLSFFTVSTGFAKVTSIAEPSIVTLIF